VIRGRLGRGWLVLALITILCAGATLVQVAPAQGLVALPSFVMSPSSGPLGTTFNGDIEFYSGVQGQPNHGCDSLVSYTVSDPNGNVFAQGDIPANIPGDPGQAFSFQVTVSAPGPVGTYTVAGVCDGFNATGQFDVTAAATPPPVLSLTPVSQSHSVGESAALTARLLDGTTGQPIAGTALSFTIAGPNSDISGSCVPSTCVTDSAGQVAWTYSGPRTGSDLVTSQIGPLPLNSGPSAAATVAWTDSYAALGDSYSSGEGLAPYEPGTDDPSQMNTCHRSDEAYPQLLDSARQLGPTLFAACSGAVTDNLINALNTDVPAQISEIPANVKTVTLTIGGNDAGFSSVVKKCLNAAILIFGMHGFGCSKNVGLALDTIHRIGALSGVYRTSATTPEGYTIHKIADVLADIHQQAPGAHIYIAGYPHLFGSLQSTFQYASHAPSRYSCTLSFGVVGPLKVRVEIDYADAQFLNNMADVLDGALRYGVSQAAKAGVPATYVDVRSPFTGHGLCDTGTPWIQTLLLNPDNSPMSGSFHPLAVGQQAYETAFAGALTP
jgi:hypothetical protein